MQWNGDDGDAHRGRHCRRADGSSRGTRNTVTEGLKRVKHR